MDGREYQAIEQNAEKPSRWGQLAREGHRVVQFKDTESNRFVAVAVDGKITVYPSCPIGCAPPQVRGTLRMTPGNGCWLPSNYIAKSADHTHLHS
jgi:hypothetical protein